MRISTTLTKKMQAFHTFKNELLQSETGKKVARIYLCGSILTNKQRKDSDIDVLIFGYNSLKEIEQVCDEIAYKILLEKNEIIEPIVYCIDDYRYPNYFIRQIKKDGKEVYRMPKKQQIICEAEDFLSLAKKFFEIAKSLNKPEGCIGVIDLAYNAIELSAKGLLLLSIGSIPKTHSGIVQKLSEIYVKSKKLSPELGRDMRRNLTKRNKARYDPHAIFTNEDTSEILNLAEEFLNILEKEIDKKSNE